MYENEPYNKNVLHNEIKRKPNTYILPKHACVICFIEWFCATYGHQILPSREDRQQNTKIQIRNDDEIANAIRACNSTAEPPKQNNAILLYTIAMLEAPDVLTTMKIVLTEGHDQWVWHIAIEQTKQSLQQIARRYLIHVRAQAHIQSA